MRIYKISVVIVFLGIIAVTACAQGPGPTAACGDEKALFTVTLGERGKAIAPSVPGKAQVYIIEVSDPHDKGRFNRPTIRQGLDGRWLGATQGFSYVHAEVDPGAHHLCSRWQSHFSSAASELSLNNFNAEPGKLYFFRVQLTTQGAAGEGSGPTTIDLQPLSEDEGRFLVSEGAVSISKAK